MQAAAANLANLKSVASYHFEHLSADNGWQPAGEQEVTGEMSSREAFERLIDNQRLQSGRYRYKRSDERSSHPWGYLTLTDGGSVFAELK
jgi:hypothetical protein